MKKTCEKELKFPTCQSIHACCTVIYDAFNSRSKSSFKHGKLLIVYRNFEIKKGFSSIWICLNEIEMFYEIGNDSPNKTGK